MPHFLNRRAVLAALGVIVVALVVLGIIVMQPTRRGNDFVAAPAAGPATSLAPQALNPAAASPAPESAQSGTPSAAPTCTNLTGAMTEPTRFVVERMGVDSPMIVVGKDEDGNPGAPPLGAASTTAWYNGSAAPGTTRGNVILTIHTYSQGQALGNELYGKNGLAEGTEGLREGDLIKISDAAGRQACYRYSGSTKVWVETYDPTSGVFFNADGPPQLAIMVCWDYKPETEEWASRIIFYAGLLPEGQPA